MGSDPWAGFSLRCAPLRMSSARDRVACEVLVVLLTRASAAAMAPRTTSPERNFAPPWRVFGVLAVVFFFASNNGVFTPPVAPARHRAAAPSAHGVTSQAGLSSMVEEEDPGAISGGASIDVAELYAPQQDEEPYGLFPPRMGQVRGRVKG